MPLVSTCRSAVSVDGLAKAERPAQRWQRGRKTQATIPMDPELLARVDAAAERHYTSRAALVSMWLTERLDRLDAETAPRSA